MSLLLGLLPGLVDWLPHILGALGGGVGLLGLIPKLRTYAMIGLGVVAVLAIGYGLIERGNYHSEKAGRIADRAAAQAAVLEQQQKAAALSDELIIAQASAMAVTEKTVVSYVDRIKTVREPDTACVADPRMRLGSEGVSDIIKGK